MLWLRKKFLEMIFPNQCHHCGAYGTFLCKDGKKQLRVHRDMCIFCQRFSKDGKTCLDCTTNRDNHLDGVGVVFQYSQSIKKMIVGLKLKHHREVANFLAEKIFLYIQTNEFLSLLMHRKKVIISYIPAHRYKTWFVRGYNQSHILALSVAKNMGFPLSSLCQKKKYTRSQVGLSKEQRKTNLKKVFVCEKKLQGDELIILIDDVVTTGSTLNELATAIKKSYPHVMVWGVVVGRQG